MEVYFFISVSVHCKDTRIVVNVGTNKPFSGRIYALGRFVAMTSKSILAGKKQELLLNEKKSVIMIPLPGVRLATSM